MARLVNRSSSRFAAAALAATLAAAALIAPVAPAGAATSVSCPSQITSITSADEAALWSLAERKLTAAATGSTKRYPFGALDGQDTYQRTSAYAWTSGFFPGAMWQLANHTGSASTVGSAQAWTKHLLGLQHYTGTHDLGFMLGIPLGLGMQLAPQKRKQYQTAYINAAMSLSSRWNKNVGAIKSGDYGSQWGVIIDSAMNMPLLLNAADMTSHKKTAKQLRKRALSHYRVLAKNFIRPDGSTAHRIAFNPASGKRIGPIPGQGLSTTSTWARGQAWAIAGFAEGYARSHKQSLLDAALNVTEYWIAHVPAGCVPAWDLDISSDTAPRDSSAAAIAAYGMLLLADELDALDPAGGARYRAYAKDTLHTLSLSEWTTEDSANPGILLRQTYNVPADQREGSYVWGDYYLLAALTQLQGVHVSVP